MAETYNDVSASAGGADQQPQFLGAGAVGASAANTTTTTTNNTTTTTNNNSTNNNPTNNTTHNANTNSNSTINSAHNNSGRGLGRRAIRSHGAAWRDVVLYHTTQYHIL